MVYWRSVSDPYSFDTDPDLAFLAEYRSASGSNPGSTVWMTKNLKKITTFKKIKFVLNQKLQFT
jgi:hypothetical protein